MRLLLVEDNHPLADVICRALQQSGYVIDWAQNAREADSWIAVQNYDVVLLDLGLPDTDGAEVLRRLRASGKHVPVLILSAREAVDERVRLLDLGADDYVVKPIALNELEARVRSLVRRSHGIADPVLIIGALHLDTVGHRALVGDRPLELSSRELAALEYLAVRARRIVTKEQLLQALYGWHDDVNSVNAVEKVISRLRTKLEGSEVIIRTVRGLGYSLGTDENQET
ncbi:MAG: response regulator transcription factor [Betaproteobacteria bacterium]|nr:response regulator transcription factor [Betaproteobacteria bacterium]